MRGMLWQAEEVLAATWSWLFIYYLFIYIYSVSQAQPDAFHCPAAIRRTQQPPTSVQNKAPDKRSVTLSGSESHYSPATSNCGYPCIETADICRV